MKEPMESVWIGTDRPNKNSLYLFQKSFEADGGVLKFKVSGNSRYRLYINGIFLCEGPCRTDALHQSYETGETLLKSGKNEILAEVLFIAEDNFLAIFTGDEPSFWFEGRYAGGTIVSDEDFMVALDESRSFVNLYYVESAVQPSEIVAPGKALRFQPVKVLYKPSENGYSAFGAIDRYNLTERKIPHMKYETPRNFVVTKSDCELEGEFISCSAKKDFFVELDAGKYVTFFPQIVLKGNVGATIKIIYSECYYDGKYQSDIRPANGQKKNRCDVTGYLTGYYDLIYCNGEEIKFSPFWFRSGRYLRIEGTGVKDVEIRNCTFQFYHYDLPIVNHFSCSDMEYNTMWNVSIQTLLCCMQETFVDCPYWEQQQYLMDSSLAMLYTFCVSDDTALIKKAIEEIAAVCAPDGLLYARYPTRFDQIIPGFSLFFAFMLKNYLMYTGDVSFVKKHMGKVESCLAFFDSKLTKEGLVGPTGYWPFVDWGKGWERGIPTRDLSEPLTYYNLLYSNALKWTEELYRAVGREGSAVDLFCKRNILNNAINQFCFVNGLYSDTPGGDSFSICCQVFAILGDICEDKNALFDRVQNSELTESSFSMNFFLLRVYQLLGRYDLADHLFDKWRDMLENNMTTWGESPVFARSECHVWSSVMLYEFTSVILGIQPIEAGCKKVQINPYTEILDYAQGSMATPYGEIFVRFDRNGEKVHLTVDSPAEIVKLIHGKAYLEPHIELEY